MNKIATYHSRLKTKWSQATTHDKIIVVTITSYLLILSAFMIWHRVFFSPDRFFIFALIAMIIIRRARAFLWDWVPPLLVLFGYEYVRGLVPHFTNKIHIHAMIYFDQWVFGKVPTLTLQGYLFNSMHLHWYDYTAVTLYFMHFIVPMVCALVFWFIDRSYFKKYMAAMIVLSYLAFITYFLFPAMPPWLAGAQGFLPPVVKIIDQVLQHFAPAISLPTVYQYFGINLVAAVPSLHAAYPLLTGLFLYKKFPQLSKLFFIYVAGVWFSVVYLGEHYVFDVVLGIGYSVAVYGLFNNWFGIAEKMKLSTKTWIQRLRRKQKMTANIYN